MVPLLQRFLYYTQIMKMMERDPVTKFHYPLHMLYMQRLHSETNLRNNTLVGMVIIDKHSEDVNMTINGCYMNRSLVILK